MATTYKFRQDGGTERLTARIYADDIEIHSTHRLSGCTTYQWMYDNLLGGNPVNATGTSTNSTYDVDISNVNNSGEYFCQVTIGGCMINTERRRISIIECLDQSLGTFPATNASGQFRVDAPHYESPIFSNAGDAWVVANGDIQACPNAQEVRCRFVQNFTLTDQVASANTVRQAQPTITIGPLVCFYNVTQDWIRTETSDGTDTNILPAPFITLTQNGPALINTGVITVTALVQTISGSTATTVANPTIRWFVDNVEDTSSTGTTLNVTSTTARTRVVRAETTVNSITESQNINVVFEAPSAAQTNVEGMFKSRIFYNDSSGGEGDRFETGTFTITGNPDFNISYRLNGNGLFEGRGTRGTFVRARFDISGPGTINGVTAGGNGQRHDATALIDPIDSVNTRVEQVLRANGIGTWTWTLSFDPQTQDIGNATSISSFCVIPNQLP